MSSTDLQARASAPKVKRRSRRTGSALRPARSVSVLVTIALGLGALLTAFPLYWMLSGSFKTASEALAFPPTFIAQDPTLQHYARLFTELDFAQYTVNTVIVVLIGAVGVIFMAMAGYGFAKFRFRGHSLLFFVVLATLMIPIQVTMIPTYLILTELNLTNTLVGIALPTLVSGFGIFLFRQFMSTIPDELLEAARLDGAGEFRTFWSIVLPISKPILAVQAVLMFITGWNSFLWPLIIASDQSRYTLSVGLSLLNQQIAIDPALQMAAATVMVLPTLFVFIFFQRYVVQGFTMSGLK